MYLTTILAVLVYVLLDIGSAQLNLITANQTSHQCKVLLNCKVTNLIRNDSRLMILQWKFNGERIYYFDAETTVKDTNVVKDISELGRGDASLWIEKPRSGTYTCLVTELNTSGQSKFYLEAAFAAYCILYSGILLCVIIQMAISCIRKHQNYVIGICLVLAGVVLIILGLCLLFYGVSVNMTIKSNTGFGIHVFTLLIVIIIQFFFLRVIAKSFKPRVTVVCAAFKIVGFIIAVVGFFISVATKDCTTQNNSYDSVIGGLVIFLIGVIGDMVLWIKGQETSIDINKDRSKEGEQLNDVKVNGHGTEEN
ncbi:leukocyte surface antigen CD47-like isoform X2 [Acipenser ruthenus]|uniref:leukocyte surface antigen CD47-like isoform X2 n=1 Tax=Acipenser ruthenus TaxID=7906 RepID=UPI0027404E64|nr:leukocyte surface antigen CD47-like isoform X2 [Acipenser ruthenus]